LSVISILSWKETKPLSDGTNNNLQGTGRGCRFDPPWVVNAGGGITWRKQAIALGDSERSQFAAQIG
jgi:hypothetical protein